MITKPTNHSYITPPGQLEEGQLRTPVAMQTVGYSGTPQLAAVADIFGVRRSTSRSTMLFSSPKRRRPWSSLGKISFIFFSFCSCFELPVSEKRINLNDLFCLNSFRSPISPTGASPGSAVQVEMPIFESMLPILHPGTRLPESHSARRSSNRMECQPPCNHD